jgi:hypothetical protein
MGEAQLTDGAGGAEEATAAEGAPWPVPFEQRLIRAGARALLRLNHARAIWGGARSHHKLKLEVSGWIMAAGVACLTVYLAQGAAEGFFSGEKRLDALRSVIVTIGGALIGGAAIAASFILFAMQVNVERLPHGLFRRLSADRRLITAVGATFPTALIVAFVSVAVTKDNAAATIAAAIGGTIIVLRLFFYSYARSLHLINPRQQLAIVIDDVRRSLRVWEQRQRWSARASAEQVQPERVRHDVQRLTFHQLNPTWTQEVFHGIRYAVALARRAAEQGDVDSSGNAFAALVQVSGLYVRAKGQTFFGNNGFIENPLVTDPVINETLDQLRLMFRGALARKDEEQMGQILRTYRLLSMTYLAIDYADDYSLKTHAHLAAAYLGGELEAIAPHHMVDALMNGLRELGKVALAFVQHARPEEVVSLAQRIGTIGSAGALRKDYQPLTLVSMEQLALLTFELISVQDHDIGYASKSLQEAVNFTAKVFLEIPDTPLRSAHSSFLGPYFSSTSLSSLRLRLMQLANAVSEAPADSKDAKRVIRNVATWADGLYISQKELLLLAVEKRSHFTLDLIHWITGVSEILLAIGNADASSDDARDDLRKHARLLAMTLSWLPRDDDTVAFLEIFHITETYFTVAIDAENRGADDLATDMRKLLLRWGMEAGAHNTRWAILEKSIYGLAVLGLRGQRVDQVKNELAEALNKDDGPSQEVRDGAARGIRLKAETFRQRDLEISSFERALGAMDQQLLRPLVHDLANILSPGTKDEPIEYGW